LGGLWSNRAHYSAEGQSWLERALREAGGAPTAERARALRALGDLVMIGEPARAETLLVESMAIWNDLGDARGAAGAQGAGGAVWANQGDQARAVPLLEDAGVRLDALGDRVQAGYVRLHLGVVALDTGDGAGATTILGE